MIKKVVKNRENKQLCCGVYCDESICWWVLRVCFYLNNRSAKKKGLGLFKWLWCSLLPPNINYLPFFFPLFSSRFCFFRWSWSKFFWVMKNIEAEILCDYSTLHDYSTTWHVLRGFVYDINVFRSSINQHVYKLSKNRS